MKEKEYNHESFAQMSIGRRTNSHGVNLYGSSIKHDRTIVIQISPSELIRKLNKDRYYQKRLPHIEVEMSYNQFAELLTSFDIHGGVPVTLKKLHGEYIEKCPYFNKREEFESELKDDLKDFTDTILNLIKNVSSLFNRKKNTYNKSEKKIVLDELNKLERIISSNLPFVYEQFNRQIDKTVADAKNDIEGYITSKIIETGIESLKADFHILNTTNNEQKQIDILNVNEEIK